MTRYVAPAALLPGGWFPEVRLTVGEGGCLVQVESSVTRTGSDHPLPGPVVPGIVNAHSHAFQRGLAGGAESRTADRDSFWSWRQAMYRFLEGLGPESMETVAHRLFVEFLTAGYTHVVEFHYLHLDPRGQPYADPAEMAQRIRSAAERAGIGLTLLPVLYQSGGFGGAAPDAGQRRFLLPTERFLEAVEEVAAWRSSTVRGGMALHSLRAVPPNALREALAALAPLDIPRHIHVAEQTKEVEDAVAWSGRRPVEWLAEHVTLDPSWSLVHCTHMDDAEARAVARSGATAVVCPTTEANLGDGFFELERHLREGGSLAVGSDSHVSTSPVEELRWLEYVQRLRSHRRSVAATEEFPSPARRLLEVAWRGGERASGVPTGRLEAGARADWIVLDPDHPVLAGRQGDGLLDAWIFSGNDSPVRETWVAGRRIVAEGRHPEDAPSAEAYAGTVRDLLIG